MEKDKSSAPFMSRFFSGRPFNLFFIVTAVLLTPMWLQPYYHAYYSRYFVHTGIMYADYYPFTEALRTCHETVQKSKEPIRLHALCKGR